MYIVLLGAPGAGKGTQAVRIAEKLEAEYISTGDMFRQAVQSRSELGLKARMYMDKGLLVPDDVTVRMLMERLERARCAVILDGFPRTLSQAEALDKALAGEGKTVERAVYIKVSENELMKRLAGRRLCRQCQTPYQISTAPPRKAGVCDRCGGELYQREDDMPRTVKKRLEVYFAETMPLVYYYQQRGKLAEVDGEGEIEAVGRRILSALGR